MAGLKETKKRIRSVKNTQKITRAMKLVSSAKYGRSYSSWVASRSYRHSLEQSLATMVSSLQMTESLFSYFAPREERRVLVLVSCTDRGLCGGLNSGVVKEVVRFCSSFSKETKVSLELFGRKSLTLGSRALGEVTRSRPSLVSAFTAATCRSSVSLWAKEFELGKWDSVYVVYPGFKNILSQRPVIERLFPLAPFKKDSAQSESLLEPYSEEFLKEQVVDYVANTFYRMVLETTVAEHAARMTAMDNATNNADKVIRDLTLQYNRARQAAITKELIEITSGAEAL